MGNSFVVFFIMLVFPFGGGLTVSSPLFIVFFQWNKLRFHFAGGERLIKLSGICKSVISVARSDRQKSPSTRSFTLRKLECFKQAVKRFPFSLVDSFHPGDGKLPFEYY